MYVGRTVYVSTKPAHQNFIAVMLEKVCHNISGLTEICSFQMEKRL